MLYIAIEPTFNISSWCRETVNGINSEICRRRFSAIYLNDIGELPESVTEGEFLVIVCSTRNGKNGRQISGISEDTALLLQAAACFQRVTSAAFHVISTPVFHLQLKSFAISAVKILHFMPLTHFSAHDVAVSKAYFGKVVDVCRNSVQAFLQSRLSCRLL